MTRPALPIDVSEPTRYRLGVAARAIAAVFGSYQLATAFAFLIRLENSLLAWMLAPLVQLAFLLWMFHARSAARIWFWLLLWTATAYGIAWLILQQGGPGA